MCDRSKKSGCKERDLGTSLKCVDGKEKKCKSTRKKNSPLNSDKDSVQRSNGSEREKACDGDLDSKSSVMIDSVSCKKKRCKRNTDDAKMSENEKTQERLQHCLSDEAKKRISEILSDIRMLSDIEKLFLYLQLPTGSAFEEDPLKQKGQSNPLGKKADEEGTLAVTWIQSHLEEDPDVSLPKQEVYDEYQSYCEATGNEALCAADFGKVMKQIFPSVKPRRLGTRGNSRLSDFYGLCVDNVKISGKALQYIGNEGGISIGIHADEVSRVYRYCYSGLKKKLEISLPALPDLEVEKENCRVSPDDTEEVITAACYVLFEWAEKLLGTKFTSLKMLASHLIDNMLVDNRSVAAFTLLLASSPDHLDKGPSGSSKFDCRSKRSDAQIHLQRKIQEKELIKEQKQKLEEQRSCLVTRNNGRSAQSRRKSLKNRKMKVQSLYNGQLSKGKESCSFTGSGADIKPNVDSSSPGRTCELKNSSELSEISAVVTNSSDDSEKCQSTAFACQRSDGSCFFQNLHEQQTGNVLLVGDCKKKKKKGKALPSESAPVCISQSLPGFIIVPSLSQVHLAEATKKTCNKNVQKYKRIQPKPLNELPKPSVMRCRAGSLGSTVLKEGRTRTEGRRSSLALLSSDNNVFDSENDATENQVLSTFSSGSKSSGNSLHTKNEIESADASEQHLAVDSPPSGNQNFELLYPDSDLKATSVITPNFTRVLEKPCVDVQLRSGSDNSDDTTGTKRHSEESELQVVVPKKPHLDGLISSEASSESLSPWTKDVTGMGLGSTILQRAANEDPGLGNSHVEVSIHELESDALIDYLHGAAVETDSDDKKGMLRVDQEGSLNNFSGKALSDSKEANSEVSELSQLRILLEKNLPHSISKAVRTASDQSTPKKPSVLMHTNDLSSAENAPQSKRKNNAFGNKEMCDIFIRNTNPYLNSESNVCSTNDMTDNQINTDLSCSSSEAASQGLITEQDLLAVMNNSLPSYIKDSSHLESTNSARLLQSTGGALTSHSPTLSSDIQQFCSATSVERSSTQTQVPSVPPSPNTRRRAFNFMPISPRHTPIPDGIIVSTASSCHSPIPSQHSRGTVSVGVGPSQPPSNAGSPFVSPRSTPIPPSRSRHSSGQSTYSASRHTPFQNFDSGVSSISSSPFISPQPTPVPLSRLRHNSSHGPCKTVTFSTVSNSQIVHTLSSVIGHGSMRLRHNSGSAGAHVGFSLLSPRSAPLSPLVSENGAANFSFPVVSESRSRHSSGIALTPLSPVSEQASLGSNTSPHKDASASFDSHKILNDPFTDDGLLKDVSVSHNPRQTRQRHASSSVIYRKPSIMDSLAEEVQLLLKNGSDNCVLNNDVSIRSRSVPLHQMLPNLSSSSSAFQSPEEKPFSTVIAHKQTSDFPALVSNTAASSLAANSDSLILHCDKPLQPVTSDWSSLDATNDIEMSTARRNLAGLLEAPLSDDLQTTLEDLRDCDTDFSKFAQELEQLSQNEEGGL